MILVGLTRSAAQGDPRSRKDIGFRCALARTWNLFSDGVRLVELVRFNQEIASKLFAGLSERTVGDNAPAIAHANTSRRCHRFKGLSSQIHNRTGRAAVSRECVNEFNRFGRTCSVMAQADQPFCDEPSDAARIKTPIARRGFVSIGTLVDLRKWEVVISCNDRSKRNGAGY